MKLCRAKIQNIKQIPVDELLDFLVWPGIIELVQSDEILCQIFGHFLSDLEVQKEETRYRIDGFCITAANSVRRLCHNQNTKKTVVFHIPILPPFCTR